MANSDSTKTTIMQLPNVIWQLIFDLIPQKNLVEQRLVSKKWKENVDQFATFQIDFFDHLRSMTLDQIFNLRIRSCSFHRLKDLFEPRFVFPLLVKDITLSNVSSENLIKILSTCRHVEKLRFFSTLVTDKQFEPDKDYSNILQLRYLRVLDIGIHTIGPRASLSKSSIFDTLLVKNVYVLHFDVLEKLNICFSMMAAEWIQLFDFISRHSATLKSLELRCMCNENDCNRSDFSEVNQIQLGKRLNFRSLIIQCDSACRSSTLHSVFNAIVAAQNSLEYVSLRYSGIKFPLLVNVLTSCKATVSSVKFSGIELGFAEVCDGSIIGNCSVLKNLALDFLEKTYIVVPLEYCEGEENVYKPICTAVSEFSLPRSLISLSWEGLWIKTSELRGICDSYNFPVGLTALELCNVGFNEDFGVTVEVFVELCERNSELKNFKLGKLNLQEGESEKWENIVQCAINLGIYEKKLDYDSLEAFSEFRFSDRAKRTQFLSAINSLL